MQYSDGNPLNAICGRGDLSADKPRAYGCYDTKVTDFRMAQQLLAEGIVGPAGVACLRCASLSIWGVPAARLLLDCLYSPRSLLCITAEPHGDGEFLVYFGAGAESGLLPFSWSGAASVLQNVSHVGEADEFAFSFELLRPNSMADGMQRAAMQPLSSR